MKKSVFLLALFMLPILSFAYDAEIDGIYYNLVKKVKQAEVTSGDNKYSGDINIPEEVTYDGVTYTVNKICENAFYQCTSLNSIYIPGSVKEIGNYAFDICWALSTVNMENGIEKIGAYAFAACRSLKTIEIPGSVEEIGANAFYSATYLIKFEKVIIPDIATWCNIKFGNSDANPLSHADSFCLSSNPNKAVTKIDIPQSVTTIGDFAFCGCSYITSISIPNSVTSIGGSAFSGCTGLTSLTIPNSVTTIGGSAFTGCTGLTSLTIPNSVTKIGRFAFSDCTGLTSITIPNSVTSIDNNAFAKCPNLEDVYCYIDNPSLPSISWDWDANSIFSESMIEYATLHVPSESIEPYQSTAPWSSFGNIVSIPETGGDDINIYEDVSNLLINPSFKDGWDGWTHDGGTAGGLKDFPCVEDFCSPVDVYQIVTGVPAGVYAISVKAFERVADNGFYNGTEPNKVYLYMNQFETPVQNIVKGAIPESEAVNLENCFISGGTPPEPFEETGGTTNPDYWFEGTDNSGYVPNGMSGASYAFRAGRYVQTCYGLVGEDGVMKIGLTSKGEQCHWVLWADFKLTFMGKSEVALQNVIDYYVNQAAAIENAGVPDLENLSNSIAGAQNASDGEAMYTALFGLADDYNAAIESVKQYETALAAYDNLMNKYGEIGETASAEARQEVENILNEYADLGTYKYAGAELADITQDLNAALQSLISSNTGISGTTGDCTWSLNTTTGVLTISGNGRTGEYWAWLMNEFPEWYNYKDMITQVVVEPGCTFIGCDCFYLCDKITSVTLPEGLTEISSSTFRGCESLSSVNIPESVTFIGNNAFLGCNITSIIIPKNIETLQGSAFLNCTNLQSVTSNMENPPAYDRHFDNVSPNCVLYVPAGTRDAYIAAGWTEDIFKGGVIDLPSIIDFADSNVKALCVANWDTNHDGELSYAEAVAVTNLGNVFSGNTSITSFNELQYFTGLTSICDYAFNDCMNLTSVIIPSNVLAVEHAAFLGCQNLTSVTLNEGLQKISTWSFSGCAFTSIQLPESLREILLGAFYYCENLQSIRIPDNVMTLGDYALFQECHSLKNVYIGDGVSFLNGSIFWGDINMETLNLPSADKLGCWLLSGDKHSNLRFVTFRAGTPGEAHFVQNFDGVPLSCQFVIPDGTAKAFLQKGYMNLSDLSAMGFVRNEFEEEVSRIESMLENSNYVDNSDSRAALEHVIASSRTVVSAANTYPAVFEQIGVIKRAARDFLNNVILIGETDVTAAAITNPDFNNVDFGWSIPCVEQHIGRQTSMTYTNGDVTINKFVEAWHGERPLDNCQISQTISGLKTGTYRLEVDAIASTEGAYLFAGSDSLFISTESGKPQHFTLCFEATGDKDVKIGIATWAAKANWIAADNFRLIYDSKAFLYADACEVYRGEDTSVGINMVNLSDIIMVEFQMQLPEGVEIAMDDEGNYVAELNGDRSNGHQLEVVRSGEGIYHFLCYSSRNNKFNNNSGELINMRLVCDDDVEAGTYEGRLMNFVVSDDNLNEINPDETIFTIEVKDYLMGDVNGDTRINGLDIVEMVDKILDRPSTGTFIFAAGDFDGNGVINGMDLVEEVALVLSQTASGAKARRAPERLNPDMSSTMRMRKNNDGGISVGVESADSYILSQFVVELSEGQQLMDITSADRDHVVAYQPIDGNRYMVICYSTRNATFIDNNDLIRICSEGSGKVRVSDVMLVDEDRKPHYISGSEFGEATGIELVDGSFAKPSDIHSISGALVRKNAKSIKGLEKGMYVVDGKVIIIK